MLNFNYFCKLYGRSKQIIQCQNNSRQQQLQQLPQQQQQNLSHLTSDPAYQQILRQLYANNSQSIINDYPQFRSNFNYNPHRNRANVEVKKATPVRNDLYIHKKSLKFTFQQENPSLLNLTFLFDNTTEHKNEQIPQISPLGEFNLYGSVETSRQGKNSEFVFSSGTNQQFPPDLMPLDLTKYPENQLTQFDSHGGYYPIIIKMSPTNPNKVKNEAEKKAMYLYATCILNKEHKLNIETKRVKIEKNNKAFIANDVYGASDAVQDEIEEKECAICLTERVDTMIIPCKHMCLCKACCSDLRFRTQKCPICRRTIERFILVDRSAIKNPHPSQPNNHKQVIKTVDGTSSYQQNKNTSDFYQTTIEETKEQQSSNNLTNNPDELNLIKQAAQKGDPPINQNSNEFQNGTRIISTAPNNIRSKENIQENLFKGKGLMIGSSEQQE